MKNCNCDKQKIDMAVCGPSGTVLPSETRYITKVIQPSVIKCGNIMLEPWMMSVERTKYVIKWNFDLDGKTITVPENCALEFDGGSLKNGTIIGQDTFVNNVGGVADIFGLGIDKQGTWREVGDGSVKPGDLANYYTKSELDTGEGKRPTTGEVEQMISDIPKDVDDHLDDTSTNPVQNKVVKRALDNIHAVEDYNKLLNKPTKLSQFENDSDFADKDFVNQAKEEAKNYTDSKTANAAYLDGSILRDINGNEVRPITSATKVICTNGDSIETAVENTKHDYDGKIQEESEKRTIDINRLRSDVNSRLNDQDAAIELLNGSDVIVVEDHTLVQSPDSQKIYREQGEDSYTDWMYQNGEWKKISTYNFPGIDNEPQKDSDKLVKSSGIAKIGHYEEDPLYAKIIVDSEDRMVFAIKKDGSIEWAVGVPTPVKEFVEAISSNLWNGTSTDGHDGLYKISKLLEGFNGVNFSGKKVSIIGDSISTFDEAGYKIDGYSMWYPRENDRSSDVTNVNDTWWKQLLDETGAVIEVNASSGGSTVTNRVIGLSARVPLIGSPDIVIIALGANDSALGIDIGNINYNADSYDLSKFAPAYIKGIKDIISLYPKASVFCVAFDMGIDYQNTIKTIADHYGALYVYVGDVSDIHPNKAEMTAVYKKVYSNTWNIVGAINSKQELVEGKTVVNKDYADGVFYVNGPDYVYTLLDSNNHILLGIRKDGTCEIQRDTDDLVNTMRWGDDYEFKYLVVDSAGKILYGIKDDGDFFFAAGIPKQIESKIDDIQSDYILPDDEDCEYVVGTYDTIILKVGKLDPSDSENKYLFVSDNLGASWYPPIELPGYNPDLSALENKVFGLREISHTHIFSNGDILICGRNKCFYLTVDDNYAELHESVVYDYNGEIYDDFELDSFNPTTGRIGFYPQMYKNRYFFHKGIELDIFGEYRLESSNWGNTPRESLHPRLWYTTNFGRTIQCAFKTGAPQENEARDSHGNIRDCSKIDNNYLLIRHFHQVGYCEVTQKFYLSTGDEDWRGDASDERDYNEIYFIEADVNFGAGAADKNNTSFINNQWSFDILCNGYMCKMGNYWFDDKYLYFVTDYTQNHYKENKGIIRCPISELHNINLPEQMFEDTVTPDLPKVFRNIYVCPDNEWGWHAPSFLVQDNNGNAALFGDDGTLGLLWASKSRFNFKPVKVDKNILMGVDVLGPNLKGDIYVSGSNFSWRGKKNARHYNLTKILKDIGIRDFFKK